MYRLCTATQKGINVINLAQVKNIVFHNNVNVKFMSQNCVSLYLTYLIFSVKRKLESLERNPQAPECHASSKLKGNSFILRKIAPPPNRTDQKGVLSDLI